MTLLKVLSNIQSKITVQGREEEKGHICHSKRNLPTNIRTKTCMEKGDSLVQIILIFSRTSLNNLASIWILYICAFQHLPSERLVAR